MVKLLLSWKKWKRMVMMVTVVGLFVYFQSVSAMNKIEDMTAQYQKVEDALEKYGKVEEEMLSGKFQPSKEEPKYRVKCYMELYSRKTEFSIDGEITGKLIPPKSDKSEEAEYTVRANDDETYKCSPSQIQPYTLENIEILLYHAIQLIQNTEIVEDWDKDLVIPDMWVQFKKILQHEAGKWKTENLHYFEWTCDIIIVRQLWSVYTKYPQNKRDAELNQYFQFLKQMQRKMAQYRKIENAMIQYKDMDKRLRLLSNKFRLIEGILKYQVTCTDGYGTFYIEKKPTGNLSSSKELKYTVSARITGDTIIKSCKYMKQQCFEIIPDVLENIDIQISYALQDTGEDLTAWKNFQTILQNQAENWKGFEKSLENIPSWNYEVTEIQKYWSEYKRLPLGDANKQLKTALKLLSIAKLESTGNLPKLKKIDQPDLFKELDIDVAEKDIYNDFKLSDGEVYNSHQYQMDVSFLMFLDDLKHKKIMKSIDDNLDKILDIDDDEVIEKHIPNKKISSPIKVFYDEKKLLVNDEEYIHMNTLSPASPKEKIVKDDEINIMPTGTTHSSPNSPKNGDETINRADTY